MLASDAAAGVDARLHDLSHRLVHALALVGIVRAVGDVGMEIAVTRMENVADQNVMLFTDRVNRLENLRQLGARNHRILDDEVGSKASHGTERLLPPLPELQPLGVVAGDANIAGTASAADAANCLEIGGDARLDWEPLEPGDLGGSPASRNASGGGSPASPEGV